MISCIIPCYGSESTISQVIEELEITFENRQEDDYEIILVNDCSPDGVLQVLHELCKNSHKIKIVDLAKNFGQHNAIMAGVNHAVGSTYVFLDDDGQTPASEIWKLIDSLDDTCDVVFAEYSNKRHASWRNLGSKVNDYMAEVLIEKPKSLKLSSYCACKEFVADELRKYDGRYPYLSGLLLRSSKRIKNVPVEHRERSAGQSGYTMGKLINLWLNGFTAFSVKPLRIATFTGFSIAIFGFIYGVYVMLRRLIFSPDTPLGWSSTMAALLFIGGMIMLMLGLIGEYVGRTYININNSPQFVVREKIGFEGNFDENE